MESSPFTALVRPGSQEQNLCPCLTQQHNSASTSLPLYFLCTTASTLVRVSQQRRVKEGQVSFWSGDQNCPPLLPLYTDIGFLLARPMRPWKLRLKSYCLSSTSLQCHSKYPNSQEGLREGETSVTEARGWRRWWFTWASLRSMWPPLHSMGTKVHFDLFSQSGLPQDLDDWDTC